MKMTDVFDNLKKLQDILADKYEIESKIEDAPRDLGLQEEMLVRMKGSYIDTNKNYEEAKTKITQLKAELNEAVAARERGEKGMDTITTHREYEALDKEIKDASEKESQLRKELQTEERHFEDLSAKMSLMEQDLDDGQRELDEKRDAWEKNVASYKAELEALKAREDEIIPDLDPEVVFKFERIIRSKQNRGIVAVKGNVCDGCHMILPAQFANEVHKGENIVFCPYCSRILVYEEQEEGGESFYNFEDAGSLVGEDFDFEDELDEEEDQDEVKELDL